MAQPTAPEGSPWDRETSKKFESKQPGEYFDPCQEAAARSLRCLSRNAGAKDMCADYFQAYRDCKKQWMNDRAEEKRKAGKFFGS